MSPTAPNPLAAPAARQRHEARNAPLSASSYPLPPPPVAHPTLTQQETTMKRIGSMLNRERRALKLSNAVPAWVLAGAALAFGPGAFAAGAKTAAAADAKIPVVAAENFYGDVVRQLGGDRVNVTSILRNPEHDPHLFEANPATAGR